MRLKELNREISLKRIRHGQNITQATQEFVLYVQDSSLLDGLAGTTRQRFARNGPGRGIRASGPSGSRTATMRRSWLRPRNRDLRRRLYEAYTSRCMDRKYDNRQLSVDIVNLRLERARMLGYENYAAYTLETNMAGTPEKVRELLLPLGTLPREGACGACRTGGFRREIRAGFGLPAGTVGRGLLFGQAAQGEIRVRTGAHAQLPAFSTIVLNDGVFYVANRFSESR